MKLFLSDFDGTLVKKDLLEIICEITGKENECRRLANLSAKDGFKNVYLKQRIDLLKGVTVQQIKQKLGERDFLVNGAKELFAYLKQNGFITVLHTGNILPVAEYYQNLLGIDYIICTRPQIKKGVIQGIELDDVGQFGFKAVGCKEIIDELKIKKENIWAIGDSIVDLPVFKFAGHTICINAKEGIEKHADFEIKNYDLSEVIKFLENAG